MKLAKKTVFLIILISAFTGCASTKAKSSGSDVSIEEQPEVEVKASTSSLMDLYISGEIPGYIE